MIKKIIYGLIGMAALAAAMSFTVPGNAKLTIQFENYVGNHVLKLDSVTYKNALGQPYIVSKFRYYITNICLKKKDGKSYISHDYYLIDEADSASKKVRLNNIPPGHYTSISFMVGVDSIHNCSGAMTGALDPMNGMFWAWNTGYVFLKMEGKSPASHSPGHLLEFHIGGYKQPYNCIRNFTLRLEKLNLTDNTPSVLTIKADLSEVFKTPTSIDFSKLSSIVDFHHSTTVANNYMDMFSIQQ